jgi:aerobic carbon-monoxide dehydrogenase small subunit
MALPDLAEVVTGREDAPLIGFTLNGTRREARIPARTSLWELLHDTLGLRGTKLACSRAVCGSCTVLIDGVPQASCATFAFVADGCAVTTIEGIAEAGHPLIEAFAAGSAFQCGYCTSGMIVLAKALLDREPHPDRETVIEWLSSNICRCTGYKMIVDAVLAAADRLDG